MINIRWSNNPTETTHKYNISFSLWSNKVLYNTSAAVVLTSLDYFFSHYTLVEGGVLL